MSLWLGFLILLGLVIVVTLVAVLQRRRSVRGFHVDHVTPFEQKDRKE